MVLLFKHRMVVGIDRMQSRIKVPETTKPHRFQISNAVRPSAKVNLALKR